MRPAMPADKPTIDEIRKRDESLHILQHALGLDDYGQGNPYRNHYVISPGCDGWELCSAHVEAGRMVRHEPRAIFGGDDCYCFVVTEAGREHVHEHSPKPPKVSRAKSRYRMWLRSNTDMAFGEWLKEGFYRAR
jgi:hypothetical protein